MSRDSVNGKVLWKKYFLAQRRTYLYPAEYKEISRRDEVIPQGAYIYIVVK